MPVEFKLPDVGEGLTEAEVVTWLVGPGDAVTEDQPVAEVETDKAVVEVPSPVDGTIAELHAEEGEMVAVGDVLVTFDVEGEGEIEVDEAELEVEPDVTDEVGEDATADAAGAGGGDSGGRVFAAPSARRLARERGVDISQVEGSGPGGRVTERDVRSVAKPETEAEAEAEAEPETEPEPEQEPVAGAGTPREPDRQPETGDRGAGARPEAAERDRTLAAPATRGVAEELGVDIDDVPAVDEHDGEVFVTAEAVREYAAAQRAAREAEVAGAAPGTGTAAAGAADVGAGEGTEREERVAYRGTRRTIGQAMEQSKYSAPHVTHHDDADATTLVEVREDLAAEAADRGITLTYLPLVVKAVVAALGQHPILNSTLDEENEEIVKKFYYNIGIAVATDAGLMVPVVKHADRKSTLQIASEMNELVEKAQERSIAREEMQGGTFTITNFGAIGGEYATPIINYPETAVLGLGAIRKRPRVVDRGGDAGSAAASGGGEGSEVVARQTLPISLSIDHRVIDGADAARFANTLIRYLENPHLLLLE